FQTQVVTIASRSEAPLELRQAAIQTLADFGTGDATTLLRSSLDLDLETPAPDSLRLQIAAGILQNDVNDGAEQLARVLSQVSPETDPSHAIAHSLEQKGASERLVAALSGKTIPRDVAVKAVRSVLSSGRDEPQLVAALSAAGKLAQSPWNLPQEELSKLLDDARQAGDAHAGERIFRRRELTCQKCHAIGGAGGQVGPDLASIGASAQPDYVLESILEPGKKIKENYHSLIVETDEGKIVTGIKLRESDTDLILRNADDQELHLPLSSIEHRADGGSLMPQGLLDSLTRTELVNLVRFLSDLGKVGGDFTLPRDTYLRSWQAMSNTASNANLVHGTGIEHVTSRPDEFAWTPAYSLVNGRLPLSELPVVSIGPGQRFVVVQSTWTNDTAVELRAARELPGDVTIWLDQKKWNPMTDARQPLAAGQHTLTVILNVAVDGPGELAFVLGDKR
ncbi:MAG: hypothetical protein KDB23_31795, partial [Planctomycetales bacterium]|nr:hypothetical protein [Planctomycetales bacterium]